jgi:hypothetical protein
MNILLFDFFAISSISAGLGWNVFPVAVPKYNPMLDGSSFILFFVSNKSWFAR